MAHTKSQLPMIRSLKAIARRKANLNYYDIPVPAEVKKRFTQEAQATRKKLSSELRALFRKQTKSLLVNLLLKGEGVPLTCVEEEQITAFKNVLIEVRKGDGPILESTYVYDWQHDRKKEARALFDELEKIELQIIAGEAVDLAPYAQRLKG